jgi:HD superfamily phosphohydrolase YqeK
MEHLHRVADLMGSWARDLSLHETDLTRWRAAGMLHDALRDAAPESLRPWVDPRFRDLPGPLLHGHAVAARLASDGVPDPELLLAIAWHTTGHPDLDPLGHGLYLADYLEPGRSHDPDGAASLRDRMPGQMAEVLKEVAARRIAWSLHRGRPLADATVRFWNGVIRA